MGGVDRVVVEPLVFGGVFQVAGEHEPIGLRLPHCDGGVTMEKRALHDG